MYKHAHSFPGTFLLFNHERSRQMAAAFYAARRRQRQLEGIGSAGAPTHEAAAFIQPAQLQEGPSTVGGLGDELMRPAPAAWVFAAFEFC